MKSEEKKMTLEEYQEKYSKPENLKAAKGFLVLFTLTIGVIIFTCLFFIVLKLYDIHKYAGYAGTGVGVILFIVLYIVPVVKINSLKSFVTNVDSNNAKKAQKYNKKLRNDIADKMIDITSKTEGISFYDADKIGKLAIARNTNNNEEVKTLLTDIYKTDVKKSANRMIRNCAAKIGISTALSQSEKLDTLFVVVYELKLIKDIVFLYGYRPSDAKMAKIYKTVITNSITAYGLNTASSKISTGVAKKIGKAADGIPFVGSAVGALIDSSIQGAINSSFTVILGFQTKKYLIKEYKLQDLLDNIDLEENDEEEQKELIEEIEKESKPIKEKKKLIAQEA
ncbi:MAG: YcjF family protein [Acholeplasmatales bacterium]|nr:YcjF family protein [Acholeplasmatales bacterium]